MIRRALLLAAAMLVLAVPSAQAAFPGQNGKIAFVSNRDEPNPSSCGNTGCNYEIYTMNPDGTGATRLTNTAAWESKPAWSPDGTRIAFARTEDGTNFSDVWVMNADGSGEQNLTAGQGSPRNIDPAWSPDGAKIVFSKDNEGIYIMDADGTDPAYLVGGFPGTARPSWSPDGSKIAYVDVIAFDPKIWTINPDGTDAQLLAGEQFLDNDPNWSPDSQQIVFDSNAVGNHSSIHTINRDGSDQASVNGQIGRDAVWSPDGAKFAFSTVVGLSEVMAMNIDGSGLTNLTNDAHTDVEPDWQPLPPPSGAANLVVQMDDSPDPIAQGGILTYTATVKNPVGPATATGVDVQLSLSASLYLVSLTPSQGSCTTATLSCELGSVPQGSEASIQVVVEPTAPGTVQATAAATLDNFDPNTANNVQSEQTTVTVGGYPRPKGATPIRTALVPAFKQCSAGEAGAVHGPPLEHPSCSSPTPTSAHLTVGTPDANSRAANFSGFARMSALYETPPLNPNNGDQSDVAIEVGMTDVRRAGDLADYTGELQLQAALRLTDRQNGASLSAAGTVIDTEVKFTIPCAATASTAIGSSCNLQTTAEAVTPALVDEAERAIWQLDRVRVFDGGADGDVDTGGNTLFATQGLFVP